MATTVLTDSTSDLTPEEQERFGVSVVALNVLSGGANYLDHHDISSQKLFEDVQAGAAMPYTSPPSADQYHGIVEKLLETHDHILSLHLSVQLSQTVNIARKAAQRYGGRVTVIDSQQTSGALAMQAERAARLLRSDTPTPTVTRILEAVSRQSCTRMGLDTLEYLRRNGRIGSATALLGGLLKMKPIVGIGDGQVIAVGRTVGQAAKHRRMAQELRQHIRQMGELGARVVVFDNGDRLGVETLMQVVASEGAQLLAHSTMGSVLSAHGGPGVCGFSVEPRQVYHDFRLY
ncbi:DegV family protein [Deinococcus sp.]|uniref:DegV family protein n=1 Tax=Deinococcus sp. TaxID=47478 RepID=UPI003B59ACCD